MCVEYQESYTHICLIPYTFHLLLCSILKTLYTLLFSDLIVKNKRL
nr:MAG TPA: hypothetical protein [Bacteriophage sp.]